MQQVSLYTDGACSGNPGPGGWAAILLYNGHEKVLSGYNNQTTNNRMEIFAVIKGLSALKKSCIVNVYSDSAYLVNAFKNGWIENWQKNSWKTSKKTEVENQDLWRQLLAYAGKHDMRWHKVKGHADNEYNNRCDALAVAEIKKYKSDAVSS